MRWSLGRRTALALGLAMAAFVAWDAMTGSPGSWPELGALACGVGLAALFMAERLRRKQLEAFGVQITDSIREGVLVVRSDGRIVYANAYLGELVGHSPQAVMGRSTVEFIHPEDLGLVVEASRRRAQGHSEVYRHRVLHNDGSAILVEINAVPWVVGGKNLGSISSIRDLRPEVQGREAVERLNRLLQGLAEANRALLGENLGSDQVNRALEVLGQAFPVDRIHVNQFEPDPAGQVVVRQRFEWSGPGAASTIGIYPEEGRRPVPQFYQAFERGEAVTRSLSGFPEEVLRNPGFADAKSFVAMPIFVRGALWGSVGFTDATAERVWTQEELAVLRTIASSLGETFQRTQAEAGLRESEARFRALSQETQRQASQLELVLKLSQTIGGELEPQSLYRRVVETVAQTFGYEMLSVFLLEGDELVMHYQHGYKSWPQRLPLGRGVISRCVRTAEPILLADAPADPDFVGLDNDVRSEIAVPLWVGGRLAGVLNAESRALSYTAEDLELLQAVAAQVGVALERAQAFANLREQEALHRTLLENQTDCVTLQDGHSILYTNPASLEVFGASRPDEVIGQPVSRFSVPGAPVGDASREGVIESGQPVPLTRDQVRNLRGETLDIEIALTPVQVGGRSLILATWRDITARQQAEASLRESEARFRALVETSPDGILEVNSQGDILYANASYHRLVGAAQGHSVAGRNVREFLHPDYHNLVRARLEGGNGEVPFIEERYVRLDGGELPVEVGAARITGGDRLMAIVRDTSQRKQAEASLKASEARFRALVQNSLDVTVIVGQQGEILYASPNAPRLRLPLRQDREGRTTIFDFLTPEDARHCADLIERLIGMPGQTLTTELRAPLSGGDTGWFEVWAQNLLADPAVGGLVLNIRDVSERKAYQSTIEHLAYHDVLTGLPNRRMLREQAEQTLAQARRQGGQATLIYLDLDRFKEVNDTLGHEAGDELLIQVARRIHKCVRQGDVLARLGGDEFAILLSGATPERGSEVAVRVLQALQQPFTIADANLRIGASMGLGVFPRDGDSLEALMRVADVAMYRAKENEGGFTFYSPELDRYSRERLALVHDLRLALEAGEIHLEYQPILDTRTGRWNKVEALARWLHPTRGPVGPAVFIPLAEETGLIRELDRRVLERACLEAHLLGLPVAVNLSARTLYDPGCVEMVEAALERGGLPARRLHLEITETSLIQDLPRAVGHLRALRELGVCIALDDFGVGHTSMGYLKDLPVDSLKIDRSFIHGIGKDPREEAILRTMLSLGQGLGLVTVAEGVETPEQMEWLKATGCHLLQGFGIARPQAKENLLTPPQPTQPKEVADSR